ncbi:NF-kappa-B essential modulator-like isoform X1 [Amphibalanus amphitrite]|uniref:NF-kappa-B essential modulator-like isoform X1 n=1 Tax=Amphibalanus amphitrite TaxID=1232801 RepID=UPI001C904844|nr:NF-kappa-B essential modulator-like isoform X1 [Amphibalanus amphitrite]
MECFRTFASINEPALTDDTSTADDMDMNYQPLSHTSSNGPDIDSWEELQFEGLVGPQPAARDSAGRGSGPGSPDRPRSRSDPSALMLSSFLSGNSAVLDLDVDQLQTKIRGVLLENTRLRDSIRDSSASLRRQCEALLAWRDECQRLREERRQVAVHCQRARDVITQLREENADLRQQLAQQPPDAPGREPQQAEPPQDLCRRGESPGPAGAEVALRSQLSQQAAELRNSQREVARLQSKLARQEAELSSYRQVAPAAGPQSAPPSPELQRLKDEAAQLRHSLESERRQRQELAAWLAGDQQYTPVLETLRQASERLSSGQAALDAHAARLADAGRALDSLSERLPGLAVSEESPDRVAAELAALRAELQQLSAAAVEDTADGGEAVSAWRRLRDLFNSVASRWEADVAGPDPAGTSQQVHTDGLQARILSMEELLGARGTECERLQRQVLQLRRDLQAIDILKAQVDVYQQDFNQERRQREQIALERDHLRNELATQQTRLRHLLARQQSATLTTTADSVEPSRPPPPPAAGPDPDVQSTVYSCPKCDMAFQDLEPLQNHANRCLDGD